VVVCFGKYFGIKSLNYLFVPNNNFLILSLLKLKRKIVMNIFLIKSLLVMLCLLIANNIYASKLISNEEVRVQVSLAVEGMKPTLPKQVDKNTSWFDAKPFGVRGLEYFYKLNMRKEQILEIPDIQTVMKNMLVKHYCTAPAIYWYRDEFIEMKWSYKDNNNENVFSIRVNPNDCK